MLELKGVRTFYGNIQALWDVDLRIEEGEIVTLVGANGAGKSTTLMSICGAVPIAGGEILFNGAPIHTLRPDKIVRLGISQVPEGRLIFPDLTVRENLELGAYLRNDKSGIAKDMDFAFDLFPILAERRSQAGGTLSGGEQQMLAVCRGLMSEPEMILLDEPSLGLAPIIVKSIFDLIGQIRQQGITVLLVEQNAKKALALSDYAYVLENGHVTMEGKGRDLLCDPAVKRAYLGEKE